jgi:hypothetical protein
VFLETSSKPLKLCVSLAGGRATYRREWVGREDRDELSVNVERKPGECLKGARMTSPSEISGLFFCGNGVLGPDEGLATVILPILPVLFAIIGLLHGRNVIMSSGETQS